MIVNLSKSVFLKGQTMTPGWYEADIKGLVEKNPKGKTDSMNHTYTFSLKVPGRPDDERPEIDHVFNSKAMGFMVPFIVAFNGKPAQEIMDAMESGTLNFDTEKAVGTKMRVQVVNEEYNGHFTNKIKNFLNMNAPVPF